MLNRPMYSTILRTAYMREKLIPELLKKHRNHGQALQRRGDPSIDGIEWKQYNTDTRDTMVIDQDKWECVSDPSKTARELLEKAFGNEPYHLW